MQIRICLYSTLTKTLVGMPRNIVLISIWIKYCVNVNFDNYVKRAYFFGFNVYVSPMTGTIYHSLCLHMKIK